MDKRFEEILDTAPIIDYVQTLELVDMCKVLSFEFEKLEGLDNRLIASLLRKRENDYSTAISNFLAVPHFKLEGKDKFFIVVLRCLDGIRFSSLYPSIKAVFALASSRDQRELHLHTLSRIVRLTSHSSFEQRWINAKSVDDLKFIITGKKKSRLFNIANKI